MEGEQAIFLHVYRRSTETGSTKIQFEVPHPEDHLADHTAGCGMNHREGPCNLHPRESLGEGQTSSCPGGENIHRRSGH